MSRRPQDNAALLAALSRSGFEFVVVGGVAAVLHGASRLTVDLDVAAPFTDDNLARLLDALRPHRPRHVTRPDLSLLDEPPERLRRFRLFLLETELGRLDVLRDVAPLGGFSDLQSVEMEVLGEDVRVISRPQLIEIKRSLARPKDIEVALELEALEESGR